MGRPIELLVNQLSDFESGSAESERIARGLPWVRNIEEEYRVVHDLYDELVEVLGCAKWKQIWKSGTLQVRSRYLVLCAQCLGSDLPPRGSKVPYRSCG